jgi:ribosomal-protein-alanine N-acetyltransferase
VEICCFPPTPEDIAAIVDLDQRALGGLWSAQTYLRELASPNSCLRVLGRSFDNIEAPAEKPSKPAMAAIETAARKCSPHGDQEIPDSLIIIGVGCYWEIVDEAHITVLAVDPCYHRRGLGRWLLIQLLANACQRGLKRATLEVRASNGRAIALYESFGFEPLGTRKRYYPDGEDALILWQNSLEKTDFGDMLAQHRTSAVSRLKAQGWQLNAPNLADCHGGG